ncbi:hypothetical protein BH09MYX1_BH09MYX1_18980 [soil metagenome]
MLRDPALEAIVTNFRDVTEKKQTAQDLRHAEARFARLSESGIIGVLTADVSGRILDANDTYLAMVGYAREALSSDGLGWQELVPPEEMGLLVAAGEAFLRDGIAPAWEMNALCKDGSRIPILVGVAMIDEDRCVAFTADLTERKRTEAALHAAESQLRQAQKMDAVGRENSPSNRGRGRGPAARRRARAAFGACRLGPSRASDHQPRGQRA